MIADREIEQIIADCRFTTTTAEEQRVLNDACSALETRFTPALRRSSKAKTGLRLAAVATLALAIFAVLFLRENRHSALWAEVQRNVAEQRWVHVSGQDEHGEMFESWSSVPLQIEANKNGENVRFVNYKTDVQEYYDDERQTITRSLLGVRNDPKIWQAFMEMFTAVARGESVKSPSPEVEIVSQSSRNVERDGKRRIEFEMKLRGSGEKESARLVFLIDPDAHLIRSMEVSHQGHEAKATFAYPPTGPESIYELGVARTVNVIDLRPSKEMLALIDGVRSSAEKFEPYIALNVMQHVDDPWYVGTPFKVWADGNKHRNEFGLVDPGRDAFQKPDADADRARWWNNRWDQLWHHSVEVCDGETLHSNNAHPEGWATARDSNPLTWDPSNWPKPEWVSSDIDQETGSVSPLVFAYCTNFLNRAALESCTAELDAHPEVGPEGTVRITLKQMRLPPQHFSEARYWIDPKKTNLVMQVELLSGNADSTDKTIITNKELAKSPSGLWYPTLVSHKTITEKDGKRTEKESFTQHYLDFETKFPKGVFEPEEFPDGQ